MSRRNKKKRLSRKFRKLHQIGKPVMNGVPRIEPPEEAASAVAVAEVKEAVRESAPGKAKDAPAAKPVYLSFEEEKSREIMGNLKTVLVISVLCLAFLGILYFFELRSDWVAGINEKVKSLMSGWTW